MGGLDCLFVLYAGEFPVPLYMLGAGSLLLYVRTVSLTMVCRELTGTPAHRPVKMEALPKIQMQIPQPNLIVTNLKTVNAVWNQAARFRLSY